MLCDLLDAEGFDVKRGVCELETAFEATAGSGPLTISVCAEYDALPGMGHACGHNVDRRRRRRRRHRARAAR